MLSHKEHLQRKGYTLDGKSWEDYGNPIHLPEEERKELKALLLDKITPKQKRFVEEFILGEYAGNQYRSYARAFDREDDYENDEVAMSTLSGNASNLLKLPYIKKYYKIVLKEAGFDSESIDIRLNQLAWQDDDKRVAMQAVKEMNRIHGRIIDRVQVDGEMRHRQTDIDYSKLSDDELDTLLTLLEKARADRDNEVEEAEVEVIND